MVTLRALLLTRVRIPCSVCDIALDNCEGHVLPVLAQFLNVFGRSLAANCLQFGSIAARLFVVTVGDCSANHRVVELGLGSSQSDSICHSRGTIRGSFRRRLARLRESGRSNQQGEEAKEKPAATVRHERAPNSKSAKVYFWITKQ